MNPLEQLRRIADGDQNTVIAAPFAPTLEQGFREFMAFVQRTTSV